MTACVLYSDEDMEAITVIDVPAWAIGRLKDGQPIRFPVPEPLVGYDPGPPRLAPMRTVCVWSECFYRNGRPHVMLFTRDDVNALKLDSSYLPGQRAGANERYRRAFLDGFAAALLGLRA